MPWKEIDIVKLRQQFIGEYLNKHFLSFSDLCACYGISRPTGYKWRDRFMEGVMYNLTHRNRMPLHSSNQTPDEICELIINKKLKHPHWGPKKLLDNLKKHDPSLILPADSTAGEILKRAGLVKKRRKRWSVPANEHAFTETKSNNQVWVVDYKGQFKLVNATMCYPLTMTDNHSRYLLYAVRHYKVRVMMTQSNGWSRHLGNTGYLKTIRSDNGIPFASIAAGGISRLSMWWIQLGIRPERIKPGHLQQNGRHERMHKTLKAETTKPASYDQRTQQKCFDDFLQEYNDERSREALDRMWPSEVYERHRHRATLRNSTPMH
ncbi:integrase core domain-containing protein [uncultured Cocleimonas sp.]|uniref:integrase core domain-containing protein n=1 Tax=uncultured Cocleimonas sp. TaxID=1051587 RepID=UPI002623F784|nr:integrase core domain-containing protein [uncultured Cocleimonas sp.]